MNLQNISSNSFVNFSDAALKASRKPPSDLAGAVVVIGTAALMLGVCALGIWSVSRNDGVRRPAQKDDVDPRLVQVFQGRLQALAQAKAAAREAEQKSARADAVAGQLDSAKAELRAVIAQCDYISVLVRREAAGQSQLNNTVGQSPLDTIKPNFRAWAQRAEEDVAKNGRLVAQSITELGRLGASGSHRDSISGSFELFHQASKALSEANFRMHQYLKQQATEDGHSAQ